ncbi:hypothetical protein [Coleofasciculus sp. F4-SAH-05]|jgi:hypothetical protein|uniref:hypothetical protein n=1 Tax=Coleofasciculus TaxID=669368 RepID=UPI0032F13C4D
MTTSVQTSKVYDEIIDFIAAGTTPKRVIDFQLSEAAKERLADLIYQSKTEGLTQEEKTELDKYLVLEHIMRLAKAQNLYSVSLS